MAEGISSVLLNPTYAVQLFFCEFGFRGKLTEKYQDT